MAVEPFMDVANERQSEGDKDDDDDDHDNDNDDNNENTLLKETFNCKEWFAENEVIYFSLFYQIFSFPC